MINPLIFQNELQNIINSVPLEQLLAGGISFILVLIFLLELRKYLKYRAFPDLMELSGVGGMAAGLFALTGDILLAVLAAILALMIIGCFEIRENPIWFRMMVTFTFSYGFFFVMVVLGFVTAQVYPSFGNNIKELLISAGFSPNIQIQQFFVGIGYNLVLWIMVLTAFIVFGRKFIIVTRFISPQMVYLVLYLVVLLLILQLHLPENLDWLKYFAVFLANFFIYIISGPLLTILFGIKPLEDQRVENIIKEVQTKIDTPIRKIGIVKAPILNAFAYGPWFDQRIAFIASDLNQFTDAEIRGITAHELIHTKKKHTLWLLALTAVEIVIKYIVDAPIGGAWELALGTTSWDFLSYWVFNIVLFAILVTFVKIMEGQADKISRENGFGIDLAESLYRLEGFYYGIAGEIGFNVQLMTGKTRSDDENIRFMGDQAYYLYRNLAPSRMTCFMNLIASHPLTSIRLAIQTDQSIGAIQAGFMIWLLLIPGLRKRTIRRLQKNHEKLAELLSQKYTRDIGTIDSYLEITYEENWAKYYIGRYVLAKPWLSEGVAYWGKVTNYSKTENIVSPIELELEDYDGKIVKISKSNYMLAIAEPQHKYYTKDGKIAILDHVKIKNGKFRKFYFSYNGNKISSKSIGLDTSEFQQLAYWLVYKEGKIQPWSLKEVKLEKTFRESIFIFEDEIQNKLQYQGQDIVISSPPLIQMIYERNWAKEKAFFRLLQSLGEPIILYDKEDIDIGTPCKIKNLGDDDTIELLEGRTSRVITPNKIDALILDYPFYLINFRKEMGLGNILSLKLFNRGLKTKYIGLNGFYIKY